MPKPVRRAKPQAKPAKAQVPRRKGSARPRAALRGVKLAAHARDIEQRLRALYPDAHCELDHRSPFELLVATILSAQCTDRRVNLVTPALFQRWPDAPMLARADAAMVEEVIRSTGFFRSKAKSLIGMAQALVARHGSQVPASLDDLVALPGVGRKTANVVLGNAMGRNEGIVVDTHVARLAARLGLTSATDAVRIEQALIPLFERDDWTMLSHLLIWHGRRVCDARKPRCAGCTLADICPSATV